MRKDRGRAGIGALLVGCALIFLAAQSLAAPGAPRILGEAQRKAFQGAVEAADKERWRAAARRAEQSAHPLASALIEWRRLQSPETPATFTEIEAFLDAWPDWPRRAVLMRRGEQVMPDTLSGPAARAWFTRFPPLTGPGRQRLAEALIAAGEVDAGRRMLRDAWIDGDFPKEEERLFLKKHRKLLTADDHHRRLDRLLWDERRHAARRLLRYADKPHRRLAEARLRLMERKRGVDGAIRRVPRSLRAHPGLVFERIRWRRHKGKDAAARQLLMDLPAELDRPGKWWFEQSYQIRQAIKEGLPKEAYAIASGHGHDAGLPFAEAEWLAGWLALRFLNRPAAAGKHFSAMHDRVRYPISRARAAYWAGRAAEAAGNREQAAEWLRRAARHPTAFYGQLAGRTLAAPLRFQVEAPPAPPEARARFEARPLVQAARILGEAGDFETLQMFVAHLSRRAETPAEHLLISRIGLAYDAPHVSIGAAKRASRNGVPLVALAYPLPFGAVEIGRAPDPPETALVLGLARQESEMDPRAVSRSGARGLMQLMPRTARQVSRRLGLRYSRSRLTEDRGYNIALGSAYLSELLEDYGSNHALALAAYNAGPTRVNQWLRLYGDPRSGAVDPIDWIELVPYAETRNYIQRVLESAVVYRSRLSESESSDSAR